MTIEKKPVDNRITIDLTGPKGNAFYLLGAARNYAEQLGLDPKKVCNEMRENDYENLVKVFDKYFGEVITLYR